MASELYNATVAAGAYSTDITVTSNGLVGVVSDTPIQIHDVSTLGGVEKLTPLLKTPAAGALFVLSVSGTIRIYSLGSSASKVKVNA